MIFVYIYMFFLWGEFIFILQMFFCDFGCDFMLILECFSMIGGISWTFWDVFLLVFGVILG